MRLFLFLISLVATIAPRPSMAAPEACGNFDARPALGQTVNQGLTEWCFAFQAADLLQYKVGRKVSPFDIALNTNRGPVGWFMRTFGRYKETDLPYVAYAENFRVGSNSIEQALARGLCPGDSFHTPGALHVDLKALLDEISNSQKNFAALRGWDPPDLSSSDQLCHFQVAPINRSIFPTINLLQELQIRTSDSQLSILKQVNNRLCSDRFYPNEKIEVVNKNFDPGKGSAVHEVDAMLTSKNEPIGINIDAGIFTGEPHVDSVSGHKSTIVGRKWDAQTGQCEYLVRDYWGNECPKAYKVSCEKGDLWIAGPLLDKYLLGATYLN